VGHYNPVEKKPAHPISFLAFSTNEQAAIWGRIAVEFLRVDIREKLISKQWAETI